MFVKCNGDKKVLQVQSILIIVLLKLIIEY